MELENFSFRDLIETINSNPNGYFDYELCKECKGKCCRHFGCFCSPLDFAPFRENASEEECLKYLVERFKTGRYAIDMIRLRDKVWGPLNPETKEPDEEKIRNHHGYLFIRARSVDASIIDFQVLMDTTKDHQCINWSLEHGCAFSEEDRPYSGRKLRPIRGKNGGFACSDMADYDELAEEWAKYRMLMYKLYLEVRELKIK